MTKNNIVFSIVIPVFNSELFISNCIESLKNQSMEKEFFEVLVIDDCSTDKSIKVVNGLKSSLPNLKVLTSSQNGGPGIARNIGIDAAQGTWIIFLDSDDQLTDSALCELNTYINNRKNKKFDAVGYDWRLLDNPKKIREGRRDSKFLKNATQTIQAYLEYRMDHSVIYTAVKKNLLKKNNIHFKEGIHEDVDFIFKVYFYSSKTSYFNKKIYNKRFHKSSITNSVSGNHINGYFRAWTEIRKTLTRHFGESKELEDMLNSFNFGSYGVVASRVREVVRHLNQFEEMIKYFELIFKKIKVLGFSHKLINEVHTTYGLIFKFFIETMNDDCMTKDKKASKIANFVTNLDGKSWSCTDLHNSVFLRSSEVRTCCKRFFVAGKMRGDVSLVNVQDQGSVKPAQILEAKQDLHQKINTGVTSPCDGCPFLEFREWGQINDLEIKYLSMEYHSLCNLRCTYCSDEYYGGKQAIYDVSTTLELLAHTGALKSCSLVVWGGGEPTMGREFANIVNLISEHAPTAQQRILTNSVKPSNVVKKILENNNGQVVTSIDAGSSSTFEKVRGRNRLKNVCKTLREYASINHKKVTIKYIFTESNYSDFEVREFVSLMSHEGLLHCNFQISGDFKQESFSIKECYSMLLMYGLLHKAGCKVVYLDELIRHRVNELIEGSNDKIFNAVQEEVGVHFIASPEIYSKIIIWGAGQQAKYLMKQSRFMKQTQLVGFVDSTPSKIGKKYLGQNVYDISFLHKNDFPIVIAAVQGYPLIIEEMNALNIDRNRLVNKLII